MNDLIHGGDVYQLKQPVLDFSVNLNPLGLPEAVQAALLNAPTLCAAYPDPLCRTLTAAIAAVEELPPAWVRCGNGAADLIFRLAQTIAPKRAVLPAPTFAEYERALLACGCSVAFHTLFEKDGFVLTDKLLGRLEPAVDFLVLCNPNNPTGWLIDPILLERILKKCQAAGIILLLDECFLPFLAHPDTQTMASRLKAFPNLVLLRAFTKFYAMPGARLGYLLCSDETLLARLDACTPPWNVSGPAQAAGIAALTDLEYPVHTRELLQTERVFLRDALQKRGCIVYGSEANFIFFKCHNERKLLEKLLEQGILIRSCANFRGLDERFYRIAVRNHAENETLLRGWDAVRPGREDG